MHSDLFHQIAEVVPGVVSFLQHELLYASLLFVLVLAVTSMLPRRLSHLHYGLWTLVLVRLLLPPDLYFSLSARELLARVPLIQDIEMLALSAFGDGGTEQHAAGRIMEGDEDSLEQTMPAARSGGVIQGWRSILLVLWISGFGLLVAVLCSRLWRYHCIVRHSETLRDPALSSLAQRWRRLFKIRRSVRLVTSDAFLSPFTMGLLRPVIFLPRALTEALGTAKIEPIIAHEMAHIKRCDPLWVRIQCVIELVYFFYPVAWFTCSRLNQAREQICDEMVLAHDNLTPGLYGESLLAVLKMNLLGNDGFELLPGIGNHKRRFAMRINELYRLRQVQRPRTTAALFVTLLVGLFCVPMAANSNAENGVKKSSHAAQETASIRLANPLPTGHISARFGMGWDPFADTSRFHIGVDVAAPIGSKIMAPADGVVEEVRIDYVKDKGVGRTLRIRHSSGFETYYTHLKEIYVEKGQKLRQGEEVASVGVTGRTTGPHLHFEVRKEGEPVDPALYVEEWEAESSAGRSKNQ